VTFGTFLLGASSTLAAVAPPLGQVQSFAVLGGSAVTGQTGTGALIDGDVGSSPTPSITNFPPSQVLLPFFLHLSNDAVVQQAQIDATAASTNLLGQGPGTPLPAQLGGTSVVPGVYSFSSTADIATTQTFTLNGPGIYIFLVGSSITANVLSNVVLNGADPCDVFWRVQDSATLNGLHFPGTVIAGQSVTVGDNMILTGRAIALSAAVTMPGDGGTTIGGCSGAIGTPPPAAPTLSKTFSPITIAAGGLSTLTITLSNPNSSAAALTADLVDTLPAGVLISAFDSNTCGGSVTATAGTGTITLMGGTIPAGSSSMPGLCTVTVDVTAASAGTYVNMIPAGALKTTNGNNAAKVQATLLVTPALTEGPVPPTENKAFNPATINAGGTSTLTIIVSNSSSDTDATAAFTDTLPAGVVIAASPASTNTCGGSLTATAGTGTITLSGGTVPFGTGGMAGTCTVTVPVTAALGGVYVNTLGPAVATLTVNPAVPTVNKRFVPTTISFCVVGGTSTVIITLTNPNTIAATNASLLDALPTGVVVAGPSGAVNSCGGTLTATPGTGTIVLTGGTIPAGSGSTPGTCTISVDVTATRPGSFLNTLAVNAVQTDNGTNSVPASATLTAMAEPAPLLSGWGMILLPILLALVAFAALRKQAM